MRSSLQELLWSSSPLAWSSITLLSATDGDGQACLQPRRPTSTNTRKRLKYAISVPRFATQWYLRGVLDTVTYGLTPCVSSKIPQQTGNTSLASWLMCIGTQQSRLPQLQQIPETVACFFQMESSASQAGAVQRKPRREWHIGGTVCYRPEASEF